MGSGDCHMDSTLLVTSHNCLGPFSADKVCELSSEDSF